MSPWPAYRLFPFGYAIRILSVEGIVLRPYKKGIYGSGVRTGSDRFLLLVSLDG